MFTKTSNGLTYQAIHGDGTVGTPILISTTNFQSVQIEDYDLDGDNDIVGVKYNTKDLVIFKYSTTSGLFNETTLISSTPLLPKAFSTGDFNNDGYPDLIGRVDNEKGTIYLNQGNSTFVRGSDFDYSGIGVGGGATAPVYGVGDLDEDGNLDITIANYVSQNPNSGKVYGLFGDGAGNFGSPVQLVTTPQTAGLSEVGYFNEDSHLDIIAGMDDDGPQGGRLGIFW